MWFLFSKVLANSLSYRKLTCVSRMFDSHGFVRCSPFWSLNPLEYLPKQCFSPVLSFALAGNTYIHVSSLASYLLVLGRQVGLIWFCIFKSSVLEILSFSFCLVNSDCDVHLPVDHSLVYSYPKLFLLFFQSNQSWAWLKTIFLDSYLGIFCSWIYLVVEFEFGHWLSPDCKSCLSKSCLVFLV